MAIPSFNETHLWRLSELLSEAVSHWELTAIFSQLGIAALADGSRKHRIHQALLERQKKDRCGNNVGKFIETVLDPARFVNDQQRFIHCRDEVNVVLAFSGLHLQPTGKLAPIAAAKTLTEAQERAGKLRNELIRRQVHPDVLKFCRAELLHENYFHAVFEATKSVAQKLRDMTGLTSDGAEIVDRAFAVNSPILAINTLRTETEQSEQKGFANLVKGAFGTFRNPAGHAPKIVWPVNEQDALDLLSMLSYIHRRLDAAVAVPRVP